MNKLIKIIKIKTKALGVASILVIISCTSCWVHHDGGNQPFVVSISLTPNTTILCQENTIYTCKWKTI